MRTRMTVTLLVVLSLGLVGVAGCGGDSVAEDSTEATTTAAATTAATSPGTPPATTSGATTAPAGAVGNESLPPPDAITGVHAGQLKTIDTAEEFVDVLYQNGDPTKPDATKRLEDAGFSGAVVRDLSLIHI